MNKSLNQKLQQVLALFSNSDVIVVGGSPMLSEVDVEETNGDDGNEVVHASWTNGENNYAVIFTEGGLNAGHWKDGCFFACDNEGDETKICFFDLVKKSPLPESADDSLLNEVEKHVLELANIYNELTVSELQEMVSTTARKIVQLVRSS